MGFAGLAEIFQAEMDHLIVALEYVQVNINNLLVFTKGSNDDHLNKLEHVLIELHNTEQKVNVAKSFSCMQETEYHT
jgi:hypothetical protein